eukprot:1808868-Pyramimonas_sp.AAC.1
MSFSCSVCLLFYVTVSPEVTDRVAHVRWQSEAPFCASQSHSKEAPRAEEPLLSATGAGSGCPPLLSRSPA